MNEALHAFVVLHTHQQSSIVAGFELWTEAVIDAERRGLARTAARMQGRFEVLNRAQAEVITIGWDKIDALINQAKLLAFGCIAGPTNAEDRKRFNALLKAIKAVEVAR